MGVGCPGSRGSSRSGESGRWWRVCARPQRCPRTAAVPPPWPAAPAAHLRWQGCTHPAVRRWWHRASLGSGRGDGSPPGPQGLLLFPNWTDSGPRILLTLRPSLCDGATEPALLVIRPGSSQPPRRFTEPEMTAVKNAHDSLRK